MTKLQQQIEALLFIAGKPLSVKKLADMLGVKSKEITEAAEELLASYKGGERGIYIMRVDQSYQMATAPVHSNLVETFIKSEQTGELTKPSLETLTIIAYRGPIIKTDLEQIRGVNCSLILRNLLIRGLIEAHFDRALKLTVYQVTLEFLEFLGVSKAEELPDYEKLHNDTRLRELLERDMNETKEASLKTEKSGTPETEEKENDDEEEYDEEDDDDEDSE